LWHGLQGDATGGAGGCAGVQDRKSPARVTVKATNRFWGTLMLTRYRATLRAQTGAAGYILLWLLGVPFPILLLIYVLRGCT
jgi:hypothetical protein